MEILLHRSGNLTCAPFLDKVRRTPNDLRNSSKVVFVSDPVANHSVNISFIDLTPFTEYFVYCQSVSDETGIRMHADFLNENVFNVSTKCCHDVFLPPLPSFIRTDELSDTLELTLIEVPNTALRVEIQSFPALEDPSTGECVLQFIPTYAPTPAPTTIPTPNPSTVPTGLPTPGPSTIPTPEPTASPTMSPAPSTSPSAWPTASPSTSPTIAPSLWPTVSPSANPSDVPSLYPSQVPTSFPTTSAPTDSPTWEPSQMPSLYPSPVPTLSPTTNPSNSPSLSPSAAPSGSPSLDPSIAPSTEPSLLPSQSPSLNPSTNPSNVPSLLPSDLPTADPSQAPTTPNPTASGATPFPSLFPTLSPSTDPTLIPSLDPSTVPSEAPSMSPSLEPSWNPSSWPTFEPTLSPTMSPSLNPTRSPTISMAPTTPAPSSSPSVTPTAGPTDSPSAVPSRAPSQSPSSLPTDTPSTIPTMAPTDSPSILPTQAPTDVPSAAPTPLGHRNFSLETYPEVLEFRPHEVEQTFRISTENVDPGCYYVRYNFADQAGKGYPKSLTTTIRVYGQNEQPDVPALQSAKFVDSGFFLAMAFDSATNRAELSVTDDESTSRCSNLFRFNGSDSAICQWVSDTEVYATMNSRSVVVPGDTVTVLGNTSLRAACDLSYALNCSTWSTVVEASATVGIEFATVKDPVAVVQGPTSVGNCTEDESRDPVFVAFDAGASTGSAARTFSYNWSVTDGDDGTDRLSPGIQRRIAAANSSRVRVPVSQLWTEETVISVMVTNVLGLWDIGILRVTVVSENISTVSVLGAPMTELSQADPIFLTAAVSVPSCVEFKGRDIEYTWLDETKNEYLNTTSQNPKYLRLPAGSLVAGSHLIKVILLQPNGDKVSATTWVNVSGDAVVAVVESSGGMTVSAQRSFVLDASASYLESGLNASFLSFSWQCFEFSPQYRRACADNALVSNTTNTSIATVAANTLLSTRVYELEVTVSYQEAPEEVDNDDEDDEQTVLSDTASVVVTVVSNDAPDVTVTTVSSTSPAPEPLVLYGQLTSSELGRPMNATWELISGSFVQGQELSELALTPTSTNFSFVASRTAVFPLRLPGRVMQSAESYTFRLSATYTSTSSSSSNSTDDAAEADDTSSELSTGGAPSTASLLIFANAAPTDGTVRVQPFSGGQALDTEFDLLTQNWVDQDEDFPLTYRFSYVQVIDSENETSPTSFIGNDTRLWLSSSLLAGFTSTLLPAGLLDVVGTACDRYGACNDAVRRNVHVLKKPINRFEAAKIFAGEARRAAQDDQLERIPILTSTFAQLFQGANCSDAPVWLCTSRNREPCSDVEGTCGPCLEGYIGVDGPDNSDCRQPPVRSQGRQQAHCFNSKTDDNETDLNCGGPVCYPCNGDEECLEDADCHSGVCETVSVNPRTGVKKRRCTDALRCPLNCGGHAQLCKYHNRFGDELDTCAQNEFGCVATCNCEAGSYGAACNEDASFLNTTQMRIEMAKTIQESIRGRLDLDAEALDLLMLTATEIGYLLDPTENATELLNTVNLILDTTIAADNVPALTTIEAAVGILNSTLPTTVNDTALADDTTLLLLSAALQAVTAGEEAYAVSFLNAGLFVQSFSESPDAQLSFPQLNDAENIGEQNFSISLSGLTPRTTSGRSAEALAKASVGVAYLSFAAFPLHDVGNTSTHIAAPFRYVIRGEPVAATTTNSDGGGDGDLRAMRRTRTQRVLAGSADDDDAADDDDDDSTSTTTTDELVFSLSNDAPIVWVEPVTQLFNVTCEWNQLKDIVLECPSGTVELVPCDSVETQWVVDCDTQSTEPQCAVYDADVEEWKIASGCDVVSYTENTTTCACDLDSFSTFTSATGEELYAVDVTSLFSEQTSDVVRYNESTFVKNTKTIDTDPLPFILVLALQILIFWVWVCRLNGRDLQENAPSRAVAMFNRGVQLSISTFVTSKRAVLVNQSLPKAFRDYTVMELWRSSIEEEHPIVNMKHRKVTSRAMRAFEYFSECMILFFATSITFNVVLYDELEVCKLHRYQHTCIADTTWFSPGRTKCEWLTHRQQCLYNTPSSSIFNIFAVVGVALVVAMPLRVLNRALFRRFIFPQVDWMRLKFVRDFQRKRGVYVEDDEDDDAAQMEELEQLDAEAKQHRSAIMQYTKATMKAKRMASNRSMWKKILRLFGHTDHTQNFEQNVEDEFNRVHDVVLEECDQLRKIKKQAYLDMWESGEPSEEAEAHLNEHLKGVRLSLKMLESHWFIDARLGEFHTNSALEALGKDPLTRLRRKIRHDMELADEMEKDMEILDDESKEMYLLEHYRMEMLDPAERSIYSRHAFRPKVYKRIGLGTKVFGYFLLLLSWLLYMLIMYYYAQVNQDDYVTLWVAAYICLMFQDIFLQTPVRTFVLSVAVPLLLRDRLVAKVYALDQSQQELHQRATLPHSPSIRVAVRMPHMISSRLMLGKPEELDEAAALSHLTPGERAKKLRHRRSSAAARRASSMDDAAPSVHTSSNRWAATKRGIMLSLSWFFVLPKRVQDLFVEILASTVCTPILWALSAFLLFMGWFTFAIFAPPILFYLGTKIREQLQLRSDSKTKAMLRNAPKGRDGSANFDPMMDISDHYETKKVNSLAKLQRKRSTMAPSSPSANAAAKSETKSETSSARQLEMVPPAGAADGYSYEEDEAKGGTGDTPLNIPTPPTFASESMKKSKKTKGKSKSKRALQREQQSSPMRAVEGEVAPPSDLRELQYDQMATEGYGNEYDVYGAEDDEYGGYDDGDTGALRGGAGGVAGATAGARTPAYAVDTYRHSEEKYGQGYDMSGGTAAASGGSGGGKRRGGGSGVTTAALGAGDDNLYASTGDGAVDQRDRWGYEGEEHSNRAPADRHRQQQRWGYEHEEEEEEPEEVEDEQEFHQQDAGRGDTGYGPSVAGSHQPYSQSSSSTGQGQYGESAPGGGTPAFYQPAAARGAHDMHARGYDGAHTDTRHNGDYEDADIVVGDDDEDYDDEDDSDGAYGPTAHDPHGYSAPVDDRRRASGYGDDQQGLGGYDGDRQRQGGYDDGHDLSGGGDGQWADAGAVQPQSGYPPQPPPAGTGHDGGGGQWGGAGGMQPQSGYPPQPPPADTGHDHGDDGWGYDDPHAEQETMASAAGTEQGTQAWGYGTDSNPHGGIHNDGGYEGSGYEGSGYGEAGYSNSNYGGEDYPADPQQVPLPEHQPYAARPGQYGEAPGAPQDEYYYGGDGGGGGGGGIDGSGQQHQGQPAQYPSTGYQSGNYYHSEQL